MCYIRILSKSDIYNVCYIRILPKSESYSAMAMPTRIISDCNVIAKITNVVDNESVGTLHIPNPTFQCSCLHDIMCDCFFSQ